MSQHDLSFAITLHSADFDCEGLTVFRVAGREAISEPFFFDIHVVAAPEQTLPSAASPGAPLTMRLLRQGKPVREIHGIIESVVLRLDDASERATHVVRLVPRMVRLSLVSRQSIFMGQTVPSIIANTLALVGLGPSAVLHRLLGDYPAEEFVVQFGETDLSFVRRRAEHLGISFFFDHADGEDKVVLADHGHAFLPLEGAETIAVKAHENEPNRVESLERHDVLTPGIFVTHDYNYRTPDAMLLTKAPVGDAYGGGNGGGIVEYGTHFKSAEAGRVLAGIRAEEAMSRQRVFRGASTIPLLSAGFTTVLEEHRDMPETALLITAVEHHIEIPIAGGAPSAYRNTFSAVPTSHTFRPPRTTPKPLVPGLVTAVIQVGPSGETGTAAKLDDEGRYYVAFHFDMTRRDANVDASRPVRMMQPFGGTGHGMHFPLRPGTEVIIAFTNGDPDRPILMGAVPNAVTRSPVTNTLPTRNRITTARGVIFEINERE